MEQLSFIFYTEWSDYFEDLSDEEIGQIMKLILSYKKTGKVPAFNKADRTIKLIFNMIKNQLDRDAEKWEETKNARSEAGKRGASKRWNTETEQPAEETNSNAINEDSKNSNAIVCHNLPSSEMAKMAVNVNVNDDVNVNANDNVNVDAQKADMAGSFTPKNIKIPSLSQIQAYCTEKNYRQDANRFFNYYNSKGWIVSGTPVASWQKLCDVWETHEKPQKTEFIPASTPEQSLPELPVCSCGNKAIYATDGMCRCANCIDHFWELRGNNWVQINKVEIGLKIPG